MIKFKKDNLLFYFIIFLMFLVDLYWLYIAPWYKIVFIFSLFGIIMYNFDKISDCINDMFRTTL